MDADGVPRLQPPPRSIGPALTARLLFGGWLTQFGWAFVCFGMVFVWIFDGAGGLIETARFAGGTVQVTGEVTGWRETSFSVNSQPVYETTYTFEAYGVRTEGASFATGRYRSSGETVLVEFVEDDPSVSRLEGFRTTPGGVAVVMTFLFPAIGLGFALFGMWKGWRMRRLLSIGRLTRGTLVSKESTSTQINNQPVMKLTFTFEAEGGGSFEAVGKSHRPESMEDEATELIAYDPVEPARCVVLDESGYQPRSDGQGSFEASRPGVPTALLLLTPGLTVFILLRYLATIV